MVSTRARTKNQPEPVAVIPRQPEPAAVIPRQPVSPSGTNRSIPPNQNDEDSASSEAMTSEGQRSTSEAGPASVLRRVTQAGARAASKFASIVSPRRNRPFCQMAPGRQTKR
jgi:hypothetical protein